MSRYNDRHGSTRLYVGRLSSRTRSRDLQDLFSRYGRVRDVDMKHDFAFVDFSDPRDADDAMYNLNGRDFDGSRIIVEFAKGGPRGSGGSREYMGRGPPPPGSGRCFNCGIDGHWARDCNAGDWKNKCYRCGERGHIERNCQNSPKSTKHGRSYSRSVSRSPSPRRGRNRSRSFSGSRSRSRSPVHKRERSVEHAEKRLRSPSYRRSPEQRDTPPHRGRKRSPSPERSRSPRRSTRSPPPMERQGSDYSQSPRRENNSRNPRMEKNSRSPVSQDGGSPPPNRQYSPETNGQNGRSSNRREDNINIEEGASPRGSESPRDQV